MANLADRIRAFFNPAPVVRRTIYNERYSPRSFVQTLDVDRVHSIIEGAEDGDPRDLFALYRDILLADNHIQNELGKRKLAVLGDVLSIQPKDKTSALDVAATTAIKEMIDAGERWQLQVGAFNLMVNDFLSACVHLLDSVLWPVAVLEKVYRPSTKPGLRYELAQLVPVPDQLLDYVEGRMRIRETDLATGAVLGGFIEVDPNRYIVHRGHLLTTPDWRGGPMRSLVIWWMLSTFDRDWWSRFLDRYGSPFLVGKYNQADDSSRRVLENAFQWAVKIGGLVVSKETEVELQQAASAQSGEAYEKFLEVCQREKSKLILGQTLSSEAKSTGLGSGVAKEQGNVREDIRQWDAMRLGQTLRNQLFAQYLEINGLTGAVPSAIWGSESEEAKSATGKLLADLKNAGITVTDDGLSTLSEKVGLPLQRDLAPAPKIPGALPLSAFSAKAIQGALSANEDIARRGAAALSQSFRGSLAPIRRLIQESSSSSDLEQRIMSYYADWDPKRIASLLESALTAYTVNGLS